jgi:hypothetical protein
MGIRKNAVGEQDDNSGSGEMNEDGLSNAIYENRHAIATTF